MQWQRLKLKDGSYAPHTLVSEHGYRLLRCTSNGIPDGRFIAFHVGANEVRTVLGGFASADDAKLACTAHFQQTRGVAA